MTPDATTPPFDRARVPAWFLGLLLVGAIVFAYQPAWNAGFIWDDDDYVTHNPLLTAPDGLQRIWFSTDSPSQYFPLVYTTFRIEHALWGLNPAGYHWVNILLHAVNALLVWRLLGRLRVPGAWLGAAIFALHPVQVESVAWITELKNVQSLCFFLLALLAWVEFVGERPLWRWYAVALVCHALALFSKTTACTLPAALLLVLWWQRKPITWARAAQLAPFVAFGLAMGLVSIWWEANRQGTAGADYALGPLERGLVASRALWFHLGKFVWPADLTFNYPLWTIDAADPVAYGWLIATIAAAVMICYLRRFVGRGIETAAVFYVAMLSPMLGFFMLYTFIYTFVTDHYQYVALLGPAALVGAGMSRGIGRLAARRSRRALPALTRRAAVVASAVVLLTLATLTWRQSRMYQNLEVLWETTIARNPASFMAHNNLGAIRLGQGRLDEAIALFTRALAIKPDHGNACGNLANAHLQQGRTDAALALLARAVTLEPGAAKPHSDLGAVLRQVGRVPEAIAHFQQALALEPDFAEAHHHLGQCALDAGEIDRAIDHLARAVARQPDYAAAHFHLGLAQLRADRLDDALRHAARAVALQPDWALAHNSLGGALFLSGRGDEAARHFETAVTLDATNVEARNNLGWCLLQSGQVAAAIAHFEASLRLQPDSVDAHYKIAAAWLASGRPDEAIAHFRAIAVLQPDNAEIRHHLALALLQRGDPRAAVAHFEAALHLQPDNVGALCDLAWLRATSTDAALRHGAQALALAQRAQALSAAPDPFLLRALAAACAEAGRYDEAVAAARRAKELAESQSNHALAEELRAHLVLYRAAAPWREDVNAAPATPGL